MSTPTPQKEKKMNQRIFHVQAFHQIVTICAPKDVTQNGSGLGKFYM